MSVTDWSEWKQRPAALWQSLNCEAREPGGSSGQTLQLPRRWKRRGKLGAAGCSQREIEESQGEQWIIEGRMWKGGCKQVCGRERHHEWSEGATRDQGQFESCLFSQVYSGSRKNSGFCCRGQYRWEGLVSIQVRR